MTTLLEYLDLTHVAESGQANAGLAGVGSSPAIQVQESKAPLQDHSQYTSSAGWRVP